MSKLGASLFAHSLRKNSSILQAKNIFVLYSSLNDSSKVKLQNLIIKCFHFCGAKKGGKKGVTTIVKINGLTLKQFLGSGAHNHFCFPLCSMLQFLTIRDAFTPIMLIEYDIVPPTKGISSRRPSSSQTDLMGCVGGATPLILSTIR